MISNPSSSENIKNNFRTKTVKGAPNEHPLGTHSSSIEHPLQPEGRGNGELRMENGELRTQKKEQAARGQHVSKRNKPESR